MPLWGYFVASAAASVVASVVSVYVIEALRGPRAPVPAALAPAREAL